MPLPPNTKVRDVDRIEVSEAFADSIKLATFDGHNVRITFCVHRYDDPRPPNPPSAPAPTWSVMWSPRSSVTSLMAHRFSAIGFVHVTVRNGSSRADMR